MTSTSRSPARHSGLHEQDQNLAITITEPSQIDASGSPSKRRQSRPSKGRQSRVSLAPGGADREDGDAPVSFQLGVGGGVGDLSPRRKARRSMQPRKSILKPNIFAQREDDTTDFTAARGSMTENFSNLLNANAREGDPRADYTIAMRPSLARRVSFASKAHVRMFEKALIRSPSKRQSLPAPRPSSGSRRSSVQSATAVQAPRFIGEGEEGGEASMEMDTASEQSDSSDEDDAAAAAPAPQNARRLSTQNGPIAGVSATASASVAHIEEKQDAASEDGSEGEMDMEVTQVMGGVTDRRASLAASEVSEGNSLLSAGGEDQTVDFTIAVGGLMPRSPPPDGSNNARNSIGYAAPHSPVSASTRFRPGDDDEVAMEETIAIGGIIGADDTMSTASSGANGSMVNRDRTMTFSFTPDRARGDQDDGEMEMTVAIGGVMTAETTVHTAMTGPRRSIPSSPFPGSAAGTARSTDGAGGTPSFARPTVSSATKTKSTTKRNVFAPSPDPSPTKPTTPRKSGMETAAEVAKRLSFGSATSADAAGASGSRKRARSASLSETTLAGTTLGEIPAKKRMMAENVFAPATQETVIVQRAEMHLNVHAHVQMGTPRKSVSAPIRLSVLPGKSPAKSPMLRRMLGHSDEARADEPEPEGEFEPPTISLGTFLEMAGVQFIESLPGARRRSSVGRGVLGQSQMGEREFALHDYTAAQVNGVLLNMYSWAANRMKADISESATQLAQTETDCSVHNPPVIKEYLSAGDDEKKIFELTFKAFKTNTQLKARERWYDWKMDLMQRVRPDVEEVVDGMREDKERLDEMQEQTEALLPVLQARQAALIEELKRERQAVAELADCDQDELKELREAISEQGAQIKAFSSELSESTTQLEKLETNLLELRAKKAEAVGAISIAKGMCDQFTKSDVFRLQDEYKSLQALHLWRPTMMTASSLILSFDAEIQLSLECKASVPDFASARVELLSLDAGAEVGRAVGCKWSGKGESPSIGLFRVFERATARLAETHRAQGNVNTFIRQVGQMWSAVQRIRQEFRLVHLSYPTAFRTIDEKHFEATTSIVYPAQRAKVELRFNLDETILLGWPESVADVSVAVKTVYGGVDETGLTEVARRTVALAAPEGYLGYLLQVCVDVSES